MAYSTGDTGTPTTPASSGQAGGVTEGGGFDAQASSKSNVHYVSHTFDATTIEGSFIKSTAGTVGACTLSTNFPSCTYALTAGTLVLQSKCPIYRFKRGDRWAMRFLFGQTDNVPQFIMGLTNVTTNPFTTAPTDGFWLEKAASTTTIAEKYAVASSPTTLTKIDSSPALVVGSVINQLAIEYHWPMMAQDMGDGGGVVAFRINGVMVSRLEATSGFPYSKDLLPVIAFKGTGTVEIQEVTFAAHNNENPTA